MIVYGCRIIIAYRQVGSHIKPVMGVNKVKYLSLFVYGMAATTNI